jgi:hypothetical protein
MNAMKKQKRSFPYQIHLVLGLIWIVVGITLFSGIGLMAWVGGGLLMVIIGFLNRKKTSR